MKKNHDEANINSDTIEIEIEDVDGRMISCEIVDGFLFKSNEYALVKNKENNTIYLFKVIGDDEEAELVIPEEAEFKEAADYYEKLVEEE